MNLRNAYIYISETQVIFLHCLTSTAYSLGSFSI